VPLALTPSPTLTEPRRSRPITAVYDDPMAAGSDPVPARRAVEWNPLSIHPASIPLIGSQCVSEYWDAAPPYLNGALPGDIGFDPLCLAVFADAKLVLDPSSWNGAERSMRMRSQSPMEQTVCVEWMRLAELKHGRLAMLAVAGWPISELAGGEALRQATNGRAPSVLNGALFDWPSFPAVVFVFGCLAALELEASGSFNGDYGFDPLKLGSPSNPLAGVIANVGDTRAMSLSEIKHGRVAMMAILGMATQEYLYGTPVIQQTPWFFGQ